MTDKERYDYVTQSWLLCVKPVNNVRKGKGCEVGQTYWFEYIHDTGDDNEWSDAEAFYRKLSDNNHYDEVYITDDELKKNFIREKSCFYIIKDKILPAPKGKTESAHDEEGNHISGGGGGFYLKCVVEPEKK